MDAYQASIFTAVLIASVLFGIVLFSLSLMIVQQQRRDFKRQLYYFMKEAELKEREQNRIAHDLHDELGPTLSLTRMQLQSLKDLEKDTDKTIQIACSQIDQVGERLGEIARNLSPRALMDLGLLVALRKYFDQVNKRQAMFIYLQYKVDRQVSQKMSIQVYLMLQEIVHNAVKYAEASYMMISITESNGRLFISCRDNGIGFLVGQTKGLGLNSIQIRTTLLKGWVDLQSNPGKGTRYFIELPFRE
jgi:signal transduction histidine kinase